jgi:hypothetical protein
MLIKLKFTDFPKDFDLNDNYFTRVLSNNFDLIISDEPDYLIYSVYGCEHLKFNCVKIFYTGENTAPNFNICDYAIGHQHIAFDERYLRWPLYNLYEKSLDLAKKKHIISKDLLNAKIKFCNFIYSNNQQKFRNEFFSLLSKYKKIDSGGRLFNNIGYYVKDKFSFQSKYKFTIAFENSYGNGYTTEKILDAFASGTVPIYWGNPMIYKDFNPKSYINVHNFEDINDLILHIKEVDNNSSLFESYIRAPIFIEGNEPNLEILINFFDKIFRNNKNIKFNENFYWHKKEIFDAKIICFLRKNIVLKKIFHLINYFYKKLNKVSHGN